MCNFCKTIIKIEELYKIKKLDRNNYIVSFSNNDYGLYLIFEEDLYNGMIMHINYCPVCGRSLNAE